MSKSIHPLPQKIIPNSGNVLAEKRLNTCTLHDIINYLAGMKLLSRHNIAKGNVQLLINHKGKEEASSCGKKSTNG